MDEVPLEDLASLIGREADSPERQRQEARRRDHAALDASMPPQDPFSVKRILAAGRRNFAAVASLWPAHEAHGRAVRAAYLEGAGLGASDFLTNAEIAQAFERSRARARIFSAEAAAVIGRRVVCSDPRAGGRSVWRLAALDKGSAWIRADQHSLIVDAESVKLVTGEAVLP